MYAFVLNIQYYLCRFSILQIEVGNASGSLPADASGIIEIVCIHGSTDAPRCVALFYVAVTRRRCEIRSRFAWLTMSAEI